MYQICHSLDDILLLPMSKIWGEIDFEESTFSCTIKYGGNGNSSASCGIQDWNNSPLAAFISVGIIFPLIIMVLSFIGIRRNTKSLQQKMIELNFSHNISHYRQRKHVKYKSVSVTFITVFLVAIISYTATPGNCESTISNAPIDQPEGIHIAQWNWDHVGIYLTITIFVVLSGLAKVGRKKSGIV